MEHLRAGSDGGGVAPAVAAAAVAVATGAAASDAPDPEDDFQEGDYYMGFDNDEVSWSCKPFTVKHWQ